MRTRDLLLCPVEAFPAPIRGAKDTPQTFTYTTPYSLVGWPCAVVRAGTSPEGLPIGVQIIGAPWRDDLALAAAAHLEAALGGWQPPPIIPHLAAPSADRHTPLPPPAAPPRPAPRGA